MDAKLYMILLGCKPLGRHTEQHDIFFGIGHALGDLVDPIVRFWPEAEGRIHLDAWREVSSVGGYSIVVKEKESVDHQPAPTPFRLFFLNLGGYKENDFEEYHYKMLVVAREKADAVSRAKETAFFRHNASTHIDDKYGVDVDDIYEIEEILSPGFRARYCIHIVQREGRHEEDTIHPGYIKIAQLSSP